MVEIRKLENQPDTSIITRNMEGDIHYIDSFSIKLEKRNNYSIDYLTALLFTSTPGWARMFLKLRDFLVKPFGLQIGMPEQKSLETSLHYNIGDRAIFFSVIDKSESEIVMAEDDKHLYFRTSLSVERTSDQNVDMIYLTTLVHFHNIWGKLYFAIVKPFHKLGMKILLTNFSKTFI